MELTKSEDGMVLVDILFDEPDEFGDAFERGHPLKSLQRVVEDKKEKDKDIAQSKFRTSLTLMSQLQKLDKKADLGRDFLDTCRRLEEYLEIIAPGSKKLIRKKRKALLVTCDSDKLIDVGAEEEDWRETMGYASDEDSEDDIPDDDFTKLNVNTLVKDQKAMKTSRNAFRVAGNVLNDIGLFVLDNSPENATFDVMTGWDKDIKIAGSFLLRCVNSARAIRSYSLLVRHVILSNERTKDLPIFEKSKLIRAYTLGSYKFSEQYFFVKSALEILRLCLRTESAWSGRHYVENNHSLVTAIRPGGALHASVIPEYEKLFGTSHTLALNTWHLDFLIGFSSGNTKVTYNMYQVKSWPNYVRLVREYHGDFCKYLFMGTNMTEVDWCANQKKLLNEEWHKEALRSNAIFKHGFVPTDALYEDIEFEKFVRKKLDSLGLTDAHYAVQRKKKWKTLKNVPTDPNTKIMVQEANPKMKGYEPYKRYEVYKMATTLKEFFDLGGNKEDLRTDLKKGHIVILDDDEEKVEEEEEVVPQHVIEQRKQALINVSKCREYRKELQRKSK